MNFLGLGRAPCTVGVEFLGEDGAKTRTISLRSPSGVTETSPLYKDGDTVKGEVVVTPSVGKVVEHQGIKVELLGQIEVYYDRGNFYDFVALRRELQGAGEDPFHGIDVGQSPIPTFADLDQDSRRHFELFGKLETAVRLSWYGPCGATLA